MPTIAVSEVSEVFEVANDSTRTRARETVAVIESIGNYFTVGISLLPSRACQGQKVVQDLAAEVVAVAAEVAEFPEVIAEDNLRAFRDAGEGTR